MSPLSAPVCALSDPVHATLGPRYPPCAHAEARADHPSQAAISRRNEARETRLLESAVSLIQFAPEGDYMTNLSQIVGQLKNEELRLTRELRVISSALAAFGTRSGIHAKTRKISAAGRARIAAAQRARWAKVRGEKQNLATMPKRRVLSADARKKIAAAQRARWARVRAQSKAA
jgi:hypothetical protein